jgi:hypothetical protein
MRSAVKLPDIQDVAFVLEDSGFVVVHVEVVWGGKEGHNRGEASCSGFTIHAIPGTRKLKHQYGTMAVLPSILSLMSSYG